MIILIINSFARPPPKKNNAQKKKLEQKQPEQPQQEQQKHHHPQQQKQQQQQRKKKTFPKKIKDFYHKIGIPSFLNPFFSYFTVFFHSRALKFHFFISSINFSFVGVVVLVGVVLFGFITGPGFFFFFIFFPLILLISCSFIILRCLFFCRFHNFCLFLVGNFM